MHVSLTRYKADFPKLLTPSAPKTQQVVLRLLPGNNKKHVVDQCDPTMFFICTGFGKNGREHDEVVIGATLERFDTWKPMWEYRRSTRRQHLGEDIQAWSKYHQSRRQVQDVAFQNITTTGITEMERKNRARLSVLNDPNTQRVRDMNLHIGQSFHTIKGSLFAVGSCYSCKLTMGYDEADLTEPIESTLLRFEGREKNDNTSSCAEILSSKWCVKYSASRNK